MKQYTKSKTPINYGLYFIMLITLGLCHQFSAFIFIFVLLGGYIASILYRHTFITRELKMLLSSGLVLFVTWLIASFGFIQMLQIIKSQFIATEEVVTSSVDIQRYVNIVPPSEIISVISNPILWIYLALLPILYLSIKHTLSTEKNTYVIHSIAWSYGLTFSAYFVTGFLAYSIGQRFLPILNIY